jgi:hypothetical protein
MDISIIINTSIKFDMTKREKEEM